MLLASRSRWRALAVLGVLAVGLLLLTACGGAATPAPAAPAEATGAPTAEAPTAVPPTTTPTEAPPTEAPTATLAPTETAEPTATATTGPSPTAEVVADASNCVTCHTSEETLQQLAKDEAPEESLSEGEG